MDELLNSIRSLEMAGNPVSSWLLAAGIAISLYCVLSMLLRFLRRNLHQLSTNTPTMVDDLLVAVLGSTKFFMLLCQQNGTVVKLLRN